MTNNAAIKTMFESANPASASVIETAPVNGSAVNMIRATASIRGLFTANITIAMMSSPRTAARAGLIDANSFVRK